MKIKIGKKIATLRNQNNMTQEQLAECLNISNAAVSKWESGSSYPDIETIPLLAKIFKVSIDSLFEFDLENENLQYYLEQAESLNKIGKTDELISLIEETLKLYPNNLELNLIMARALLTKSMNQNPVDEIRAIQSINFFDKCLLIDHEGKNRDSIMQNKAFIYGRLSKYEEANKWLSTIKQDRHIIQIADNYVKMGEIDKAMNLLQTYFNDFCFSFSMLASTLTKCFIHHYKNKESYDLSKMVAYFREYLTLSDNPNYYDFLSSKDFIDVAVEAYKTQDYDEMWNSLDKAVFHAIRFDSNPSYKVCDVRFLFNLEGEFYNENKKASNYILKTIQSEFKDFNTNKKIKKYVDKLISPK